jgi:hypothetical protein
MPLFLRMRRTTSSDLPINIPLLLLFLKKTLKTDNLQALKKH